MIANALILLGSPKRMTGASANLGNYIGGRLKADGLAVETMAAYGIAESTEDLEHLMESLDRADLLLVSFPLYWDTLPSGLTEAFLKIIEMKERLGNKKRSLAAVCNCGFPESSNCHGALRSVELFGQRMGMEFLGGMAIGQGGVLGDGRLEDSSLFKKNLARLGIAAGHLSKGERVPEAVIEELGRPFIPRFLYTLIGNMNWNSMAKKNGVRGKMRARPYEAHG